MKRILTAVVLVPAVVLTIFMGPYWLVTAFSAVAAGLAGWELLSFAPTGDARQASVGGPSNGVSSLSVATRVVAMVAIGLLFGMNFRWPDMLPAALGGLSLGLLVWCAFALPTGQVMTGAAQAVFALLYTGATMVTLPMIFSSEDGKSVVLFLLCAVWAGDITALYVGRAWGRHRMAPRLSPNKTWEGAAGSMAGSVAIAAALYGLAAGMNAHDLNMLLYTGPLMRWVGLAAVVNVAAQVGDLVESALKRSAGVKDSGRLLPGHGGMLDRVDALLLAAPVLWYVLLVQRI